jgi:RNase P/RNase MRP subunit p29
MVWPFKTSAFVGRRGRTGATGRRAQSQRISIESLESRIALSVANDSDPLACLPVVVSPPALTQRAQAVVAAPTVSSRGVLLAESAERLTIRGTGFDPRPGRNVVAFDGGVAGKVVSATRRELVVQFTQKPSAPGTLSATVTTNGRNSGAAVGVATVVEAPAVTVDTASLARSAKTLTIRGTGFDPANLTNKVRLSGGATGIVTAATATTLTVAVRNLPAAGTQLRATVTSFGGTSGAAVTVATIVRNPIVQSSTDQIPLSSRTVTIRGSGFDPNYKNSLVTFNLGAVGYVTSATKNILVIKFTSPPTAGRLNAVVTSFGGSSNAVQVATVQPATTTSPYSLSGETDGGVYAQSFSYTGMNNGYTVELISDYPDVDLYNFTTSSTDISWTGTTTTSTYSVTMTATTSETNVSGDFTFYATLPGIISSYKVYDGTTLLGSGKQSD